MNNSVLRTIKIFFYEPQWEKVRGLFWFALITLVFHILWRIWALLFQFAPIAEYIYAIRSFLVHQAFNDSTFLLKYVFKITFTTEPHVIITNNKFQLYFGESASGLKQMCQFAFLILLFPGPWKNKAWFLPAGLLIVHLTNIFRILCFVIIAMHWPRQVEYAHVNYLKALYYIVIFILWLIWVEKITLKTVKK